ncbi:hypothetical protein OEV98_05790 [Caldibacillus lycopersici]|uniref:Uncharacterized protein n=1 Tax=Perspicuibacillus lycopersici TaxID=1325689 RepID=A0AAE3LML8_9BACI|nr:hypothetical protein [Perspicuibacillus lycopersici]MCU9613061.1 hypothetical protein [Perspicuibacillus lycopersici]
MEKEWERFKSIKDSLLIGIYAKQLSIHQYENKQILISDEPVLEIRNSKTNEIKYWKLDWLETMEGDDLLIVKEQETPEPLAYESIDAPYQKHIISGSSYFPQKQEIKHVSGYGFTNGDSQYLTSIILQLEASFIHIHTGPVIETKITSIKPDVFEDIIFTTTS